MKLLQAILKCRMPNTMDISDIEFILSILLQLDANCSTNGNKFFIFKNLTYSSSVGKKISIMLIDKEMVVYRIECDHVIMFHVGFCESYVSDWSGTEVHKYEIEKVMQL